MSAKTPKFFCSSSGTIQENKNFLLKMFFPKLFFRTGRRPFWQPLIKSLANVLKIFCSESQVIMKKEIFRAFKSFQTVTLDR